ncbi:MAG: PIN domain-containing protein [Candidatus Marinimicrobia bacterium]|nr:PIN domain-containing protein [Candidatus Neomarinimicrobiota bacterium]
MSLESSICVDPDDDKFIACALGGKCNVIISGDKHLLNISRYKDVDMIKPREFVENYSNSD